MPIPDPLEVEDGVTLVTLADMIALQRAVNDLIGVATEHAAALAAAGGGGGVTEQFVRDLIQAHADADQGVHGADGDTDERLAVKVGGGKFIFGDHASTEVPVGVFDNDIRIGPAS